MSEKLVQEALVELLSESFRRVVCVGRMRVRRQRRRVAVGSPQTAEANVQKSALRRFR